MYMYMYMNQRRDEDDVSVKAEWHLLATWHAYGLRQGIANNWLPAWASLQRPAQYQIPNIRASLQRPAQYRILKAKYWICIGGKSKSEWQFRHTTARNQKASERKSSSAHTMKGQTLVMDREGDVSECRLFLRRVPKQSSASNKQCYGKVWCCVTIVCPSN